MIQCTGVALYSGQRRPQRTKAHALYTVFQGIGRMLGRRALLRLVRDHCVGCTGYRCEQLCLASPLTLKVHLSTSAFPHIAGFSVLIHRAAIFCVCELISPWFLVYFSVIVFILFLLWCMFSSRMPSFLRESFTSTRMYLSSAEKASCSKATASSRATLTRLGHRQTPDVKVSQRAEPSEVHEYARFSYLSEFFFFC